MRQKMRFRILSFVMAIVMIFGILGYGGSKVQVLAGAAVSINEVTVIPQGAKGFFIDDLGTANSSAVSKYSAYAQGNVTAQGDFMKYTLAPLASRTVASRQTVSCLQKFPN